MAAELIIKIITDASKASDGIDQASGKFGKFGDTMGKLAAPAAGVLAAITTGAVIAVGKASDLEQAFGAVDAVFQENASTVKAWAQDASDSLGISSRQYAEFASVIGAGLKNAGLPMEEVAGKTDEMIRLGADLAATFGGSTTDAVNALGSALRGEADPAEAYGLNLKQSAVNARMAEQGLDGLTGTAYETAKAQTILALAAEGAGGAVGAAGREMDTVAGQQAKLNAKMEEMAAALGTALLPIVEPLVAMLAEFAGWIEQNAAVVGPLIAAIAALAAGILVLNVVMAANPIGLIIVAVAALVVGIIALWNTNEDFRNFFIGLWEGIASFFKAVWEGAVAVVGAVVSWFRSAWASVAGWFQSIWAAVAGFFQGIWNGFIGIVASVVNAIRSVIGSVAAFFQNAWAVAVLAVSSIIRTLQGIFTSVFNAIMGPINAVVGAFNAVIGAIKSVISWLGKIKIPDLGGIGAALGIGKSMSVAAAPAGLSTFTGVGSISSRAAGSSGGGGGVVVNINGGLDSADAIARRVRQVLTQRDRRTGGVQITPEPAMSRTGVGCRVLINGAELDDGCLDWGAPPDPVVPQGVAAAEGLSLTWGRSTTVDQPQSSTCSFTVIDDPGGATVLQTITLGAEVEVYADALITPDPGSDNTFQDPSFDVAVRGTPRNATLTREADGAGGWSAWVRPVNTSLAASVVLAPGPLQAPGTNPAAWATIQSTLAGETWTIRAHLTVPPAVTVTLRPALFSGPYAAASTVLTAYGATSAVSGPVDLEVSFPPGMDARWVGLYVEVSGGASWADVQAALTWAGAGATWSWDYFGATLINAVEVLAPEEGSAVSVLVFSGRITDLEGYFDEAWAEPALQVTASDFLADLGNRYVGEEPWPLEDLTSRVTRILAAAAKPGEPPVQIDIAASVAAVPMSRDDVDNQAASGLLTDVAQSVDAVLWSATHPVVGPYIRLEDPAQRLALYELQLQGGLVIIAPVDFEGDPSAPPSLSACDVLRDPVTFTNDVSDLATRAEVSWQAQTTDDEGQPTTEERRVRVINEEAEVDFGTRSISVSTLLATEADGTRVAQQLLARLGADWRIGGIAVNDADLEVPDSEAARMLVLLLNGVTRGGQALLLTDLPEWSPVGAAAPLYLEGGTYQYTGGGWGLELIVSRAAGLGQSTTWNELPVDPAWHWDAWEPSLTWDDLRGVAAP